MRLHDGGPIGKLLTQNIPRTDWDDMYTLKKNKPGAKQLLKSMFKCSLSHLISIVATGTRMQLLLASHGAIYSSSRLVALILQMMPSQLAKRVTT
jgi:hypothetical protein